MAVKILPVVHEEPNMSGIKSYEFETECSLGESKQPKSKWTRLLVCTTLGSTFGAAVPGGYCVGIINSPAVHMRAWVHDTLGKNYGLLLSTTALDTFWALIVSIYLIGGVLGSAAAGWAANRFGRRGCFLLSGLLLLIGAACFLCCRWMHSVELLLLGRVIVGLGSGLITTSLPMYHSEIASISQRGTLGVGCALGFSIGLVFAQIFSLQSVFGGEDHWHIALCFYVIFMTVCYAPYRFYAESPKWLFIVKHRREEARLMLQRLRGNVNPAVIDEEMAAMELETQSKCSTRRLGEILRDPRMLLPLVLLFAYQGGQQLSGVNAIFYYSVLIFRNSGLSASAAEWMNLCAGNVNLLTALMSPLFMAKFNRRILMQLSTFFCAVFLFAFAWMVEYSAQVPWFSITCMASIFLYLIAFQLALGPMPSFIGAELFEVSSRSVALSLGNQIGWACNFIVGMIFPALHTAWGSWVFLLFSMFSALLFLLTKFYLPETRGREISYVAKLVSRGFRSNVHQ
ncbi:solute carrier family 2, facilitated glucose transporter member 3-like [Scaptodrosophila lebanonensis]|uniref:Solute carrier family 2, facilitated glucose transporter member 3-like n=1 Tax=Drosophila lebanonensis TaxID=7225 RepID=A0A6J2T121_DROLE|nr:solute carrier family 2, facilitated glucose transporter member 3-like [Scaptodrosophila lebanonensis]